MSYAKHVSEVNKLAKSLNVSNADVFALVLGILKELTNEPTSSLPDVNDVTVAMVSYVEKFVKISEMIQSNPELLKLTQENVLGSFSNIKWWEK